MVDTNSGSTSKETSCFVGEGTMDHAPANHASRSKSVARCAGSPVAFALMKRETFKQRTDSRSERQPKTCATREYKWTQGQVEAEGTQWPSNSPCRRWGRSGSEQKEAKGSNAHKELLYFGMTKCHGGWWVFAGSIATITQIALRPSITARWTVAVSCNAWT